MMTRLGYCRMCSVAAPMAIDLRPYRGCTLVPMAMRLRPYRGCALVPVAKAVAMAQEKRDGCVGASVPRK